MPTYDDSNASPLVKRYGFIALLSWCEARFEQDNGTTRRIRSIRERFDKRYNLALEDVKFINSLAEEFGFEKDQAEARA